MSHSCLTTIIWILPVHTSWSLSLLRPCHASNFRQGWACDWIHHRIPLIQDLQVPESPPPPSFPLSINANNRHLMSHSYLTTSHWIMPVCTSQSLPPLRPCLTPHRGCECTSHLAPSDLGLANPRIISTNPVSRVAVCFAINSIAPSSRLAIPQTQTSLLSGVWYQKYKMKGQNEVRTHIV